MSPHPTGLAKDWTWMLWKDEKESVKWHNVIVTRPICQVGKGKQNG